MLTGNVQLARCHTRPGPERRPAAIMPPMLFKSDNAAGACPEVLAALTQANQPSVDAYDGDPWSQQLDAAFSEFFDHPCRVFPTLTGTAANSLALATLCPTYGAVLCHDFAHIHTDECGAPEFFAGGLKLLTCPGDAGRLDPERLQATLDARRNDVHQSPARALSLTQPTELGSVYTPEQLQALGDFARRHGLRVHMDGARFANALVHLNCHPGDISWRVGVDILCFGTVKNGGLSAEAVVVFDPALADELAFRRKRAGQMHSKGRYQAAQLLAYLNDGVWQRNARHANQGAAIIGAAAGARLAQPVEANIVWVRLDEHAQALREQGVHFYSWPTGLSRLVVSWDTSENDVGQLAQLLRSLPPA